MGADITDPEARDADTPTSTQTDDRHPPSKVGIIKGRLKDLLGLPPGDGTPDGVGRPPKRNTVPEGGLTSPEAEGLNPHGGSGFQVQP